MSEEQDKEEEKLRIQEEKDELKAKRKSGTTGASTEPLASGAVVDESEPSTTKDAESAPVRTSMEDQASLRMKEVAADATGGDTTLLSSTDVEGKKSRMSWLKNKLSTKRSSKVPKSTEKEPAKDEKGFVGGAALTGASANDSSASLGASRDSVATPSKSKEVETAPAAETSATIDPATETEEPAILASETKEPVLDSNEDERIGRPARRESDLYDVSPAEKDKPIFPVRHAGQDEFGGEPVALTATDDDEEFQEARDNFDEDLAPPPTFPAEKSSSPAREAKFTEVID